MRLWVILIIFSISGPAFGAGCGAFSEHASRCEAFTCTETNPVDISGTLTRTVEKSTIVKGCKYTEHQNLDLSLVCDLDENATQVLVNSYNESLNAFFKPKMLQRYQEGIKQLQGCKRIML